MPPSDLAVKTRDRLNVQMAELTDNINDQEANILACCIALAVEEIEKWMYNGEFTPSVAPFREGKEWVRFLPKPGIVPGIVPAVGEDPRIAKPKSPWEGSDLEKMAAGFQRIKAQAAKKQIHVKAKSVLDGVEPDDWDDEMMLAFRVGNVPLFITVLGKMIHPVTLTMLEISEYLGKMKKQYPHLWRADMKEKV